MSGRCAKLRHRRTQSLVKQNLLVCVREMILAANHVRDSHLDVVDHDREVVERMAVRTQQYKIFDFRVTAFLRSINNVVKSRLPFDWQPSNEQQMVHQPQRVDLILLDGRSRNGLLRWSIPSAA